MSTVTTHSDNQHHSFNDDPLLEKFKNQIFNKTILFPCVGTDVTKMEVYEYIKNLGLNLVVVDSPTSALAKILEEKQLAEVIYLDMTSRSTLVDEVQSAVDLVLDGRRVLDGVTTFWDDAVSLCTRLAFRYGVKSNPIRSTDLAHDKAASRQFVASLGMPGPYSQVVSSAQEVKSALERITLPAIMKPLYGAASIGVVKVETAEKALESFESILETLKDVYSTGELMGLTFDDADDAIGKGHSSTRAVVFEEFLDGPEFDCDVALQNGEVIYCNLMDDWAYEKPHFIELGSSCPSTRPEDMISAVQDYGPRILQAMGFTDGVFHVEVIYSHRLGPCLVEVNPRMGGGPVRSIHKSVYGVDLVNLVLAAAFGVSYRPLEDRTKNKTAVTINLFAQKSGVLSQATHDTMDYLSQRSDVVSKIAVGQEGERLTGWFDGYPSALGRVNFMIEGEANEAIKEAKRAVEKFYSDTARLTL